MADSSDVSHINIKLEHIACEVCLECFDDKDKLPRTLPCDHSFCTQCLTSVWDRAPDGVICPKCHHLYPVEGSIESSFAVSGMLKGITEYMLLKNKPEEIRCHECPDNQNAEVRCVNCREFMCSSCAKCHKKFAGTKHHKTVSLSELVEMPAEEFFQPKDSCDIHPHMSTDLFCETCTTPVCSSCTLIHHKDHNIHDLNDVYTKKKQLISTILADLQKSTTENEMYRRTLNSDKTKLDEILKTRLEEIEKSVNKLVTQIKNVSEQQKEEVRSNVARQKALRDRKLNMIGQLEADRADHVTACERKMQFARQSEFINVCGDLENETNSLLENSHIVDISLEEIPRDDIFVLLQNLLAERPVAYSGTNCEDEKLVSDTKKTRKILFDDQQSRLGKVLLPKLDFSLNLSSDTPTYYETECVMKERQTKRKTTQLCQVAELGLCVKNSSQYGWFINKNVHVWYVQVLINTDNSFYVKVYSRTHFVHESRVAGYSDNSVLRLTLGWLLDTRTKTLHVIDVKQSKLIYSIHDVDASKPLTPMFYNSCSTYFNVTAKVISGESISLITDTVRLISNVMQGKRRKEDERQLQYLKKK